MPLSIEIFSDVVCPWCYIGKRRFEAALEQFEHRDEVEITWRAFELDPDAPRDPEGTHRERLAAKLGRGLEEIDAMQAHVTELAAAEGLEYHLDRARGANTFDAHRLLALAREQGLQDVAWERLMHAYFSEGENVSDRATLIRLGGEIGVDAQVALDDERYAEAVREDEDLAARMGIRGVPFFVLGRRFGVSGAQPADAFLEALRQAWTDLMSASALARPG
jgi:predicted DsbA family dithiol-disulfide isomerase